MKDFAVFYISSTAIVVLGIIFNNELCALEDRFDTWRLKQKTMVKKGDNNAERLQTKAKR